MTTKKLIDIGIDGETVLKMISTTISGNVYVAVLLESERVILFPFSADTGVYETTLSDFKSELTTIISEIETLKTIMESNIVNLKVKDG